MYPEQGIATSLDGGREMSASPCLDRFSPRLERITGTNEPEQRSRLFWENRYASRWLGPKMSQATTSSRSSSFSKNFSHANRPLKFLAKEEAVEAMQYKAMSKAKGASRRRLRNTPNQHVSPSNLVTLARMIWKLCWIVRRLSLGRRSRRLSFCPTTATCWLKHYSSTSAPS